MFYFRVAGFLFRIETSKEQAMRPRMGNYHPFEVSAAEAANERTLFRLAIDGKVTLPDTEPVAVFPYDLTEDKAVLRIYGDRCILSITHSHSGVEYLLEWPSAHTCDAGTPEYVFNCDLTTKGVAPPPHILDHFAVQAFSFAAAARNTLLIHASTIVYEGKAVMFLAESGTGKSTHTRLWCENINGAELLNDDAPALRIMDGRPIAYGTPWSGKLPCYKNEQYPLAACVRIRRAGNNEIHKQSAVTAFGALLPSTLPTLQQREDMLDAICDTLSATIAAAPVYILDCLPDADAARTSCRAIYEHGTKYIQPTK